MTGLAIALDGRRSAWTSRSTFRSSDRWRVLRQLRTFHWRIAGFQVRSPDAYQGAHRSSRAHVADGVCGVIAGAGFPHRLRSGEVTTVRDGRRAIRPSVSWSCASSGGSRSRCNVLHQTFGGLVNPLILLSVTDGIPPLSAHQAAAQAYPGRDLAVRAARSSRSRSRRTGAPTNSVIPVRAAHSLRAAHCGSMPAAFVTFAHLS